MGAPFQGHTGDITSVRYSPDSRLIASSALDGTVRLWDLDGIPLGAPLRSPGVGATSVAFSPDGKTVAGGGTDGRVRLWRTDWAAALDDLCSRLRYHPLFDNSQDKDLESIREFVASRARSYAAP